MNGITIDLKAAGVVVSTVDSAWDNCLSNWSISCFIFAIINSNLKMSVKYNIEWKKNFFLNPSKLKLHTLRMIKALKVSYTSMWYVVQFFIYICYTEFDQSGSWLKLLCRSSKFHYCKKVICDKITWSKSDLRSDQDQFLPKRILKICMKNWGFFIF